jgi:hypothetical protein
MRGQTRLAAPPHQCRIGRAAQCSLQCPRLDGYRHIWSGGGGMPERHAVAVLGPEILPNASREGEGSSIFSAHPSPFALSAECGQRTHAFSAARLYIGPSSRPLRGLSMLAAPSR